MGVKKPATYLILTAPQGDGNMKRYLLLLPLCVICVLANGLFRRAEKPFALPAEIGVAAMASETNYLTGDLIDEKARRAQDSNEASVRALADEVFTSSHFAEIPANVLEKIKERVVPHELKYRQNKKGIKEKEIVKMVNDLAAKTGAPDYAKTSPLQVRSLRARLMTGYPNFISPANVDGKRGLKRKVGTSMNPDMSPLEAVFVAGVLLEQKMINEEFQHSPQEWEKKLKNKELKNWQGGQKRRDSGRRGKPQLAVSSNPKAREMREVIAQSPIRMNPADLINIVDDSLDTLGIER